MSKEIIVIGSGLAGMSCAAYLGKAGHRVTVIEMLLMVGDCKH